MGDRDSTFDRTLRLLLLLEVLVEKCDHFLFPCLAQCRHWRLLYLDKIATFRLQPRLLGLVMVDPLDLGVQLVCCDRCLVLQKHTHKVNKSNLQLRCGEGCLIVLASC